MKNLINFYASLFFPLSTLVAFAKIKLVTPIEFAIFMGIYCLIYNPLIQGLRLIATKKISKTELWKTFIPMWNWKYFAFLFFNSEK